VPGLVTWKCLVKFHVIVLSEICSYNIDFYNNILSGYKFRYVLPSNSSVGGIGIYVLKVIIKQTVISDLVFESKMKHENLWLEISSDKMKCIISVVYIDILVAQ